MCVCMWRGVVEGHCSTTRMRGQLKHTCSIVRVCVCMFVCGVGVCSRGVTARLCVCTRR